MRFDLRQLARRATNRRRRGVTTFRDIVPPAVLASDLYRAGYAPVVDLWRRYTPRIMGQYERTLSSMTTDSPVDFTDEFDQAEAELSRLMLLLRPTMRDWTIRTEAWFRNRWRSAVLSATGVDLNTMLGPEDVAQTLEATLAWNVDLVKDVSAQARQRISAAVFDGLRARTPARDVARRINEATGMARDRALRVSQDQLSKITSSLADERRRQAGIEMWEWRSSQKKNYRPEHAARNGKVYTDETAPKDLPGQLPYCGCRSLAQLSWDDD